MTNKNKVLLVLTDRWCDWEASYAIAVLNSFTDYHVVTVAVDLEAKVSMGGLKTLVDETLTTAPLDSCGLILLPGGLDWQQQPHPEIADFVSKALQKEIPIAAICGATYFLGSHGFLNQIPHTGDSLAQFDGVDSYTGAAFYQEAQLVNGGTIITANETAAVEFAYEVFKLLKADSPDELAEWYENFSQGMIR